MLLAVLLGASSPAVSGNASIPGKCQRVDALQTQIIGRAPVQQVGQLRCTAKVAVEATGGIPLPPFGLWMVVMVGMSWSTGTR